MRRSAYRQCIIEYQVQAFAIKADKYILDNQIWGVYSFCIMNTLFGQSGRDITAHDHILGQHDRRDFYVSKMIISCKCISLC